MKENRLILKSIDRIPKGKPFSAKTLECNTSYANARKVLSRLVKSGKILRATRGIYVRPKNVPYLGQVLPSSEEIIKAIAKQTGETISIHGAEAAYRLQLSTQVPMKSIYYTTGSSRHIKIGNLEISLKHISPSKLVKPGTTICVVISALWYLGKDYVNTAVMKNIAIKLGPQKFKELLKHTERMPSWMAESFNKYLQGE